MIPFCDANAHIGLGLFGGSGNACRIVRYEDGVVIIFFPILPARIIAAAYSEAEGQSVGIARDNRFRKDNQLSAVLSGFVNLPDDLFCRRPFIKHNRRRLYECSP